MSKKLKDLKVRLDDHTDENLEELVKKSKQCRSDVVRDLINKSKVEYVSNGKEILQKICQVHADINAIAHDVEQRFTMLEKVVQEKKKNIEQIKAAAGNGKNMEMILEVLELEIKKENIVLNGLLEVYKLEKYMAKRRLDDCVDFSYNN